ncbi:MAG: hypothetical protein IKA64_07075 [Clostridia bacterium]|nr:hypothetical protein [Clostridia bacterium]
MKVRRILALALLLLTLASVTLLASGCAAKPGKLDPGSISYDGETLSWGSTSNTERYDVKINGTSYVAYSTSIAHRSEAASVTIDITPVSSRGKEGKTVSRSFKKLDTITSIRFDEMGRMSWDSVAGASAYLVEVNGRKSELLTSCSYNSFDIGKSNTIRVRAMSTDNSTYSYWSQSVTKTYLAPPSNIKFDGSRISWSGFGQAEGYDIFINGSKINSDPVTQSFYLYDAGGQSFDLSVQSIGNGTSVFSSKESESHRYVYLAPATNFVVDNGKLLWDAVDGAVSYAVSINGTEKSVSEPVFASIPAGKDNIIKVKPVGNTAEKNVTYFSDWSVEQNVHILAPPTTSWNNNMNLDGEEMNAFRWEPSSAGVSGYEIILVLPDGTTTTQQVSADRDNFGYAFIESGTYKISVKAVAESGSGFYDSAPSDPITVIRLAPPSPDTQSFIVSNPDDISTGFTANFVRDAKAMGYRIYKEGAVIAETTSGNTPNVIKISDIVDPNVTTRQEITYAAQAIGSGKETLTGGNRVVTLSSLSANSYTFIITVLSAPQDLSIEGSVLAWASVQGAQGYKVSGIGSGAQKSTELFDFNEINITPGDYTVRVCARGDGSTTLASPLSAPVRVRKLAAPTDLHVVTSGESAGRIECDDVRGATGYSFFFNGEEEATKFSKEENIYDSGKVTETGVSIRVMAVADSYYEDDQIYCLSSDKSTAITLTKLQTPVFPETPHNNRALIWNAPQNVTASPGYEIYTSSGLAYPGIYVGTEFDLSGFDAGTYTFSVKAIGDGRTTISSDESDRITITKLETPEVSINADQGVYFWRGVDEAQRYVVRVNGDIVATIPAAGGSTYYSYAPVDVFTRVATYSVTVTAVSDSAIDSTPYRIDQQVAQISSPTFQVSYSATQYAPGEKILVYATATDPNANGFVFTVGGATSEVQESNRYECATSATGTYGISVVSVGARFDSNLVYYINSPSTDTKSIILLGSVGTQTVKLTQAGRLSWGAVNNATNGYEIEVTYDDGTTETFTTSNAYYTFDLYDAQFNASAKFDITKAQNYTFRIRALGNNAGNIIASAWITWTLT